MPGIVDFWSQTTPGTVTPQDFIAFDGAFVESKIEDDPVSPIYGHFTDGFGTSALITTGDQGKGLEVEAHKQTWLVMAKGLTDANPVTGLVTCRLALASIEAVLAYRNNATVEGTLYTGDTGSFPAQKRGSTKKQNQFHNKTIMLAPVAESLLVFKESAFYTGADAIHCDLLITQIADCSYWVANDGPGSDCDEFFARIGNYNQALSVVHFLQVAGVLHADPDLTAKAQVRLQQIFDEGIQQVDKLDPPVSDAGVIYEAKYKDNVGFDGSYMGFSLQSLASIYLLLEAGTWKDTVEAQLLVSIGRWLQTMDVDTGVISDEPGGLPWTRTHETTPRKPTLEPHGWSWDNFSYRALLLNYIFGDSVVPDVLPDKITEEGRTFGHVAGDPLEDQLYILIEEADIAAVEGLSATVDWAALGRAEREGDIFIIPVSVLSQPEHEEHEAALSLLPQMDIRDPDFPAAL